MRSVLTIVLAGLFFFSTLAGCVRDDVVADMAADTTAWRRLDAAGPLPAVGWVRGQADTLHIYIEGDGVAYSTPTKPSLDPTPITPGSLLLAKRDNAPSVAYLGRPCQYVTGPTCSNENWTTGRFSSRVIQTENKLVDAAKAMAGARTIVLIGFSGGGAVAALLAGQRTDVIALITVCGNLDHSVWTQMHNVTPLHGSLNPADDAARLSALPQVHFLGGADTNVTRAVTESFVSRLGPGARATIQVVPALPHGGEDWAEAWPGLLDQAHELFSATPR